MDYLKKYRFAVALAIVLALLNVVTISFILLSPLGAGILPGRDRIQSTIENELRLTDMQKQRYALLRSEHFARGDSMAAVQSKTMDSLFAMLKEDTVDSGTVMRLAGDLGSIETRRSIGLFEHFRALRAICTPGQQAVFDTVIVKVLEMIRTPPGPPPPGAKPPR